MRAVVLLALMSVLASAEPVKLRMAAVAPDGASWTREVKAFARDVELRTQGRVQMKWYFGSIAGDEIAVLDRIQRNQIDGEAGVQFCQRVAPSTRVSRLVGLVQSYDEAGYVFGRLRSVLDGEFRAHGYWGFVTGMGSDILFSRIPVRSLAELRKPKLWVWDLDTLMGTQLRAMGLSVVPLPIEDALRAFEEGRIDGYDAIPTGALAFQWSSRTRYFSDLRFGFVPACMIVANRVFDSLSVEDQKSFRDAAAKLEARFHDLATTQDRQLVDTLFEKQGLTRLPVGDTFRAEFFGAAREARRAIPASVIAPELITQVDAWLADYRAEHPTERR